MRRIQVTGAVDTYDQETGRLVIVVASQHRGLAGAMIQWIARAPLSLGLGKAYKKRTTGKNSQCAHLHGHLQQLVTDPTSEVCGTDMDALAYAMRYRAISWGWKYRLIDGLKVPYDDPEGTSYEYGRYIDCVHHFAAEIGFTLYEGEDDEAREKRVFLEEE